MKKEILLMAGWLIALGGLSAKPQPDAVVEYKSVGEISLNLHVFNPEEHSSDDQRPAIVFFFGGGWFGGTPQQFYNQSRYFASRGMVAISAEYRTHKGHGTSPKECVMDAKSAIRWVRSHAAELGVDPDRIVAGGGSAGGHLAAATSMLEGFDEPGEDLSISSRVAALVLYNPVFDNGPSGYGYGRVAAYWEAFSPMHNINAQTPPTLVMLGTEDDLIPVATAEEYKKRMDAVGVRCDVHLYEGQGHGFFNQSRYAETLYDSDLFLGSLGFVEGEPTVTLESGAVDNADRD